MAKLLFYDDSHTYEVDGVKYPSVSEILRFISHEEYSDVNQYILDNAAQRGTIVHKATESIDKFGSVEIDDEYVGYLQAYISFLKDHTVKWQEIERAMYHPDKQYAGTIDRVGEVDGELSLVDIKTNSAIKKALVKAQVNGYEDMRIANRLVPCEKLYCLQLLQDGRYRLYETAKDMTEFNACLALHRALEAKHRRGRID